MALKDRPDPAWSGRVVLEPGWALFRGQTGHATFHKHYAVQIMFSAKDDRVKSAGTKSASKGRVTIISSMEPHQVTSSSHVTDVLFVDPLRYQHLAESHGADALACANVDSWISHIRSATAKPKDLRLAELLRELDEMEELAPGYSARDAARQINLSSSRFSALFRAEMKLPFRQWVLWSRLQRALSVILSGSDLTSAAYAAGFSDSAHLARTMKSMFGVSLSKGIAPLTRISI